MKRHKASLLLQFSLFLHFLRKTEWSGCEHWQSCRTLQHPPRSAQCLRLRCQTTACCSAMVCKDPKLSNQWQQNIKHSKCRTLKTQNPLCFQNGSCYLQRYLCHWFVTVRATNSKVRMPQFKTLKNINVRKTSSYFATNHRLTTLPAVEETGSLALKTIFRENADAWSFSMEIHFSKMWDLLFSIIHCSTSGSGWQTTGLRLWAKSQTEPHVKSSCRFWDEKAWTAITQLVPF